MWRLFGATAALFVLGVYAGFVLPIPNTISAVQGESTHTYPYLSAVSYTQLPTANSVPTVAASIIANPAVLDARFAGMLLHVRWLLERRGGTAVETELNRLDKQILSVMDGVSEDIHDLREDIDEAGGLPSGFVIDNSGTVTAGVWQGTPILDAYINDILTIGTGSSFANDVITPNSILSSGQVDEYCLTYESTGTTFEWELCGGGVGLASTDIDTSSELAAILTDETGTGSAVFSASPTFTGTMNASAATLSSTLTMSGSSANIILGSNWLSGDGGDEGIFVSSDGRVGVGINPTGYNAKFIVSETKFNTSGGGISASADITANPTSNSTAALSAAYNFAYSQSGNTFNIGSLTGTGGGADHSGTGVLSGAYGLDGYIQNSSSGTITSASVLRLATFNDNASGVITTLKGIDIYDISNAGSIDNTYGLYIGDLTAGTQTNQAYSIYASDPNTRNYFANNVGIGTTTPNHTLTVHGNINLSSATGAIYFDDIKYLYASSTNDSVAFGENAGGAFNSGTTKNVAIGFEAGRYASSSAADESIYIGNQAGYNNVGWGNIFLGRTAGYNGVGYSNFFVGDHAGYSSAGNDNVFMGQDAGRNNLGESGVFIGFSAGGNNTGLYNNNFFGYTAGENNSGDENNAFGQTAGMYNAGDEVNMFGWAAGYGNTGDRNNFFGTSAGYLNTGDYNEMIGYQTGRYLRSTSTVAIGAEALFGGSSYESLNNVALGYRAGYTSAAGSGNNILVGYRAADNLTTGNNNIIIGYDIDNVTATADNRLNIGNLLFGTGLDGTGTTLASGNIGIGTTTPDQKLTVQGNINLSSASGAIYFDDVKYIYASSTNDAVTIGESAGAAFNSQSQRNLAVGYQAAEFVSGSASVYNQYIGAWAGRNSSGSSNLFIGVSAGETSSGDYNIVMGDSAGYTNTGFSNVILGTAAGSNNSGAYNNFLGDSAGFNNTGNNNNFLGERAGFRNTGDYNEFIGYSAGYGLQATATIAIGSESLYGSGVYSAVNNVALGYRAGYVAATGADNNILIGYQAADNLTTGNNNIIIGYDIDNVTATADNRLNIGNLLFGTGLDGTGTTLASGNVGIGTTTPAQKLQVFGNIRVGTTGSNGCIEDYAGGVIGGTCSSDERLKENIEPLASSTPRSYLESMAALTPVIYNWNETAGDLYSKNRNVANLGLIAQDVEESFPELVSRNEDGFRQVDFRALPFYIIEAMKELWAKVQGIDERVEDLEQENEYLKSRLNQIEDELNVTPPPAPTPEPIPEPITTEPTPEPVVTEQTPEPSPVLGPEPVIEPTPEPII